MLGGPQRLSLARSWVLLPWQMLWLHDQVLWLHNWVLWLRDSMLSPIVQTSVSSLVENPAYHSIVTWAKALATFRFAWSSHIQLLPVQGWESCLSQYSYSAWGLSSFPFHWETQNNGCSGCSRGGWKIDQFPLVDFLRGFLVCLSVNCAERLVTTCLTIDSAKRKAAVVSTTC